MMYVSTAGAVGNASRTGTADDNKWGYPPEQYKYAAEEFIDLLFRKETTRTIKGHKIGYCRCKLTVLKSGKMFVDR